MKKKNVFSQGSYLIVKPTNEKGGVTEGVVFISNMNKNYILGDIIYYLKQDTVEIVFEETKCHAITYYNILAREGFPESEKDEIDNSKKVFSEKDFTFGGLNMCGEEGMKL